MRSFGTLFTGQTFFDLPQVDSTNAFALDLLSKSKPPEGTVISTYHQTAGRGQIDSVWESEQGKNISLSIIFYPVFLPVQQQFILSQAISLAVHSLVTQEFGNQTKIKWPNDIYVANNKIAGILIQNNVAGKYLRSSVVGIGINVNQEKFLTNPPNPTSFMLEKGGTYDLEALIASLMQLVEGRYLQLKSGKTAVLQADYLNALYLLNTKTTFQRSNGQLFEGSILGVTESGKLEIETKAGVEVFDFKQIRFLSPNDRRDD